MRGIKKTLFTLNIDNYAPEITKLTYPLMKYYADKIGADFYIIAVRVFNGWPVTYEKLQIHEIAKKIGSEWNIYIDGDALIHPDSPDWTNFIPKNTIAHHGRDFANIRWRYDEYFRRDDRNIGSANWFTIASDWCLDLWRPLDLTYEQAVSNIFPTLDERNGVVTIDHLIDDYAVSSNISRFGLKSITIKELQKTLDFGESGFVFHVYNVTEEQKLNGFEKTENGKTIKLPGIPDVIDKIWKVPKYIQNYEI